MSTLEEWGKPGEESFSFRIPWLTASLRHRTWIRAHRYHKVICEWQVIDTRRQWAQWNRKRMERRHPRSACSGYIRGRLCQQKEGKKEQEETEKEIVILVKHCAQRFLASCFVTIRNLNFRRQLARYVHWVGAGRRRNHRRWRTKIQNSLKGLF